MKFKVKVKLYKTAIRPIILYGQNVGVIKEHLVPRTSGV